MNERRGTRRGLLSALIGGAAILWIGRDRQVEAKQIQVDGYGSKAAFKKDCEDVTDAEFIDSPKDKMTICVYADGDKKVCDQKGNNCWLITSFTGVPGGQNPSGGIGVVATTDVGEAPAATPGNNATDAAGDAPKTARGRRNKRRERGKGRKS